MIFFSGWGLLIPIIGAAGLAVTMGLAQATGGNLPHALAAAYLIIGALSPAAYAGGSAARREAL